MGLYRELYKLAKHILTGPEGGLIFACIKKSLENDEYTIKPILYIVICLALVFIGIKVMMKSMAVIYDKYLKLLMETLAKELPKLPTDGL